MEEIGPEPDAPIAKISKGQGEHVDNASDSGDEATPDYSQISTLAAKALQQRENHTAIDETIAPFIPKRGEKDFEPTGFEAQARALEKSRKAMFDVIRCERIVASKNISIATWEPSLNRAVVDLPKGILFSSMGVSRKVSLLRDGLDEDLERYHHPDRTDWEIDGIWKEGKFYEKTRSRLELFPEEALYMVERGSLECRLRSYSSHRQSGIRDDHDDNAKDWIPMSVQQAFATMLFKDDLTREKYQLYAYLKRLGYVVQRRDVIEQLRASAALKRSTSATMEAPLETKGVIADPRHPLRMVTIIDLAMYPLRRILQIGIHSLHRLSFVFQKALQWLRNFVAARSKSRASINQVGRGVLGIGGKRWERYEEVFERLRIVPSGHDSPLRPRLPASHLQRNDEVPEVFFYAWRPATRFKKTDPPLPEYRIAIVDARKTTLPSLYAFQTLLNKVPLPLTSEDLDGLDEDEQKEWRRALEEKRRNDESYGRGAVKKHKATKAATDKARWEQSQLQLNWKESLRAKLYILLRHLMYLAQSINHVFSLLPPGCASPGPAKRISYSGTPRQKPFNVFPPLKAGRKNVIVAVNDCGTTSLLRFGESDFNRWRLAGSSRNFPLLRTPEM